MRKTHPSSFHPALDRTERSLGLMLLQSIVRIAAGFNNWFNKYFAWFFTNGRKMIE